MRWVRVSSDRWNLVDTGDPSDNIRLMRVGGYWRCVARISDVVMEISSAANSLAEAKAVVEDAVGEGSASA